MKQFLKNLKCINKNLLKPKFYKKQEAFHKNWKQLQPTHQLQASKQRMCPWFNNTKKQNKTQIIFCWWTKFLWNFLSCIQSNLIWSTLHRGWRNIFLNLYPRYNLFWQKIKKDRRNKNFLPILLTKFSWNHFLH